MIYTKDIPPEIWSLIFDFALDASVTPHEICNLHNFPQLCRHLRSPKFRLPVDNSWGHLRLVCRAFKALAGGSPHFFVRRDWDFDVPASTRAAYIGAWENVMGCMERLVQSPIKHQQIVTLNIIHGYSTNPRSEDPSHFWNTRLFFPTSALSPLNSSLPSMDTPHGNALTRRFHFSLAWYYEGSGGDKTWHLPSSNGWSSNVWRYWSSIV